MENSNNSSSSYNAQLSCFREWMSLQGQSLNELLQAIDLNTNDDENNTDQNHSSERMRQLIDRNLRDFKEYAEKRSALAQDSVSPYFTPTWCSSLEGSMLWAGGCRPTSFIRLTYALSGHEILSHLDEYLGGGGGGARNNGGGLWDLSASQMRSINSLQMNTVKEEDELTNKLACLQEEMADQPIAILAKEQHGQSEPSREACEALDELARSTAHVLREADRLRLSTLENLVHVLTPDQAVELLAAGKKLHLFLHEWGQRKDQEQGRPSSSEQY